jgi:hypothetical protein
MPMDQSVLIQHGERIRFLHNIHFEKLSGIGENACGRQRRAGRVRYLLL